MYVMHNNRGYHQEVMHVQRMCNRRQRGATRANHADESDDDPERQHDVDRDDPERQRREAEGAEARNTLFLHEDIVWRFGATERALSRPGSAGRLMPMGCVGHFVHRCHPC